MFDFATSPQVLWTLAGLLCVLTIGSVVRWVALQGADGLTSVARDARERMVRVAESLATREHPAPVGVSAEGKGL